MNLLKKVGFLLSLPLLLFCVQEEAFGENRKRSDSGTALTVFVVRHAEAYKNLSNPGDLSKEKLDSLTPTGMEQAVAAGKFLEGKGVVAAISSPTGRTRETAETLAKGVGLKEPPAEDVAFSSLKKGEPPVAWSWREESWRAGQDPRPPGGESLQDGMDRAVLAVEALAKKHSGGAVAIVTHSDICAALIGKAEGTPIADCYRKHEVPTGSVSEISISGRTWTLKSQGVKD